MDTGDNGLRRVGDRSGNGGVLCGKPEWSGCQQTDEDQDRFDSTNVSP